MKNHTLSRWLFLIGVLASGACSLPDQVSGPGSTGSESDLQTQPVGLDLPGSGAGMPRILIDASRDGGVWWFPQVAPFSASSAHQGKALADALRASGYVVEELPRPFTITGTLLRSYDVVVRATGFGTYTGAELSAYDAYVKTGGKLLLLGDHMANLPRDGLAENFGIMFVGVTRGENLLSTFAPHAVTADIEPLRYMVGSGIVGLPASAQIVGRLSDASYLDLNNNSLRDSSEVAAPAVLGVMTHGSGRIVFSGDTNLWEQVPERLLKNVLAWFKSP